MKRFSSEILQRHIGIGMERVTRRQQKERWRLLTRDIVARLDEAVSDPSLVEDVDTFAEQLMVRASRLYRWAEERGKDQQSKLERDPKRPQPKTYQHNFK